VRKEIEKKRLTVTIITNRREYNMNLKTKEKDNQTYER